MIHKLNRLFLFFLLFFFLLYGITFANDTTLVSVKDSLKIIPSKWHGSILNFQLKINKRDFNFDNFYSTSDIIFKKTSYYELDLGFPRHNTYFSAFLGNARDNSISFNGVVLNNLEYEYAEINLISPEFFENIEIMEGSDAVIFSGKSVNINFQEKRYNSARPFTKMWYSQSGYELIASDGQFSKNLLPNTNFLLAFSNLGSDGRYSNQAIEHWNLRSSLRYNFDSSSCFSINYNFNNRKFGLNGGVLPNAPSPENEFETEVFFNYFSERNYRTDLIATYSQKSERKYILINGFFTHQENQLKFKNEPIILQLDTSGKEIYYSYSFGLNAFNEFSLNDYLKIYLGGELKKVNVDANSFTASVDELNYNTFANSKINISSSLSISAGLRYERRFGENLLSFGGKILYNYKNNEYFIDFSRFKILPNLAQGLDKSTETNYLFILGVNFNELKIKANVFYRRTNNPLIAELSFNRNYIIYSENCNCISRNSFGTSLFYEDNFLDKFFSFVKITAQYSETNKIDDNIFPYFYLKLGAYYEYTVGKSILRAGSEAEIYSPIKALYFYPISKDFTITNNRSKWMGNGINLFLSLRLGNAFLRMSLENILGQYYYRVKYYPMLDRVFHLTLTWAFND